MPKKPAAVLVKPYKEQSANVVEEHECARNVREDESDGGDSLARGRLPLDVILEESDAANTHGERHDPPVDMPVIASKVGMECEHKEQKEGNNSNVECGNGYLRPSGNITGSGHTRRVDSHQCDSDCESGSHDEHQCVSMRIVLSGLERSLEDEERR